MPRAVQGVLPTACWRRKWHRRHPSTGKWTFTNALIAGFGQQLAVDLSGDGVLLFTELAQYTEGLMAMEAGQLSMHAAVNDFPVMYVIGTAEPRCRQPPPACEGTIYAPGSRVAVRDESGLLPATVLAERRGIHLVRIDGRGEIGDMWVGEDDIFEEGGEEGSEEELAQDGQGGPFAVGDCVETTWGDRLSYPGWYPGVVTALHPASYTIAYDDGNVAEVTAPYMDAMDASADGFEVGARVQAMWKEGTDPEWLSWYPGVIESVHFTYDVAYPDNSRQYGIEECTMRAG